jgi:hypothetical protein
MNHRFLRPFSAFLLISIFLLGSVPPFNVSASQPKAGNEPAEEWVPATRDAEGFILFAAENHEVGCREAATEDEQLVTRGDLSDSLHVISPPRLLGTNGLTITLRATQQLEGYPDAKNAFIRAAQTWEGIIANPISIIIDVDFGPTRFGSTYPQGVLGSTSSQSLLNQQGYPSARTKLIAGASSDQERTLYNALPTGSLPTDQGTTTRVTAPSTLLRAIGEISADANPNAEANLGSPPSIGFNSFFAFDFDPSNGIEAGRMDFDAVAVHEIGHALGFTSRAAGSQVGAPDASMWDVFRFQPGITMNDFTSAQRVLTRGGTPVFYVGGSELRLSTADDGQQTSHWKDDNLTGQHIGIMDPSLPFGRRFVITTNDLVALDAMGYRLKNASGGGSGGGGGGGGGTTGNNLPSTSQFNAALDGDVLTITGIAADSDGDIQQGQASLLDQAGGVLSQGTPISMDLGISTQSPFTVRYTNMRNFPSAMKVSFVFTDSRGNQSAPVTADFSRADSGGATINKSVYDTDALVIKGVNLVSGLQVEINGVLVTPQKLKVKGTGAKVVVTGSKTVLNLSNGTNRVRVKIDGKFSNIALATL